MVINEISSQRRQDSNWGFDEITCKLDKIKPKRRNNNYLMCLFPTQGGTEQEHEFRIYKDFSSTWCACVVARLSLKEKTMILYHAVSSISNNL